MCTQSLKRYIGAADGWTVPCAEAAQGESKMSCLDDHPPLAGVYPASGQPHITHQPQHSEQVTWSEFYNLAADGFTLFKGFCIP